MYKHHHHHFFIPILLLSFSCIFLCASGNKSNYKINIALEQQDNLFFLIKFHVFLTFFIHQLTAVACNSVCLFIHFLLHPLPPLYLCVQHSGTPTLFFLAKTCDISTHYYFLPSTFYFPALREILRCAHFSPIFFPVHWWRVS